MQRIGYIDTHRGLKDSLRILKDSLRTPILLIIKIIIKDYLLRIL